MGQQNLIRENVRGVGGVGVGALGVVVIGAKIPGQQM